MISLLKLYLNLQENLLNNVILRGVKNIPKVTIRKIPNYMVLEDGNYIPVEIWVLDTIGTNLSDLLTLTDIDVNRTFSNDIQETFKVLGVEAARQTIANELSEVLEFDGTYINSHHIDLLCDRMTATKKMYRSFDTELITMILVPWRRHLLRKRRNCF